MSLAPMFTSALHVVSTVYQHEQQCIEPCILLSLCLLSVSISARSLIAWVLLTGLSLSLSLSPAQTQKGSLVEEGRGGKVTLMALGAITDASVRGSGVMSDEIPHVHSQGDSPVSAAGLSPRPHHLPGICQAQVPSWRYCACSNIHFLFTCSTATAAAKSLQSCPTLCDPRDGSPPGSPIPGILQARTLEWVAISFSKA